MFYTNYTSLQQLMQKQQMETNSSKLIIINNQTKTDLSMQIT